MAMRSVAVLAQARGTMLLIAPPPLADRQGTGGKEPCSGLDTAFADRLYQTKAMVVSVFHLTDQIKVTSGSGHNAGSLLPARRPALPPAGRPSPAASSDSHTSTPLGGNDVPFQFHLAGSIAKSLPLLYAWKMLSFTQKNAQFCICCMCCVCVSSGAGRPAF